MVDGPGEASESDEPELIAVVLPTLFCGLPEKAGDSFTQVAEVARAWQVLGSHSVWAEVHGTSSGVLEGRPTELLGRAAAAGEQLALAATLIRDGRHWLTLTDPGIGQPVAIRALAEMAGYYTLSAAHGLVNTTLRALLLAPASAEVVCSAWPKADGFPPFSEKRDAWVSMTASSVEKLKRAASAHGGPQVASLVHAVGILADDPRWHALEERRNVDYHRWRPQSISGGVAKRSPWDHSVPGQRTLSFPPGERYEPTSPALLLDEAEQGTLALSESMDHWSDVIAGALVELGLPVFSES